MLDPLPVGSPSPPDSRVWKLRAEDGGKLPMFSNLKAPLFARRYYNLPPDSMIRQARAAEPPNQSRRVLFRDGFCSTGAFFVQRGVFIASLRSNVLYFSSDSLLFGL